MQSLASRFKALAPMPILIRAFLFVLVAMMSAAFSPSASANEPAQAQPSVYIDSEDPMLDVQLALDKARATDKLLLIVMGAQWCHDSRGLASKFTEPEVAAVLSDSYEMVFVDVGYFKDLRAISQRFNQPHYFATPTVMIVNAETERLINAKDMHIWGSADRLPTSTYLDYFSAYAKRPSPEFLPLPEAQAKLLAAFERLNAQRLNDAYAQLVPGMKAEDASGTASDEFLKQWNEVRRYRSSLQRDIQSLREQAIEAPDEPLILPAYDDFSWETGQRQRARDLGIEPGILTPGHWNAITDVKGVSVGHFTLNREPSIHTGITVVLPHQDDLYRLRVPAAVFVGNGFGKALGFTQVQELGELETPIGLTNTLSVHSVANGIADYMLTQPGNETIRSINPVVGETNDGFLNDIRARSLTSAQVGEALADARSSVRGRVQEGNVGAGAGTSALGFKGGIGTSSRVLPSKLGSYTVGVLVQSNFGGILSIDGAPVGEALRTHYLESDVPYDVDGSCMIIVATDAPISDRNLERLAKRAFLGIARVGGFASNGSGDYVIAFSNNPKVLRSRSDEPVRTVSDLNNDAMTPLFLAAVEATEEAILNSLFMAEDVTGHRGSLKALPVPEVLDILEAHQVIVPGR